MLCLVAQSCLTPCNFLDCNPPGSSVHGDSPGKNTGMGCHALFQGIFPIQGSNPGLLHCRWILYHLSHHGSPWILEWAAYLFFRGSSWPGNRTEGSCIEGRFFASWATRGAQKDGTDDIFAGQQWQCRHRGQTCGHLGKGKGGTNWESSTETYTLSYVK